MSKLISQFPNKLNPSSGDKFLIEDGTSGDYYHSNLETITTYQNNQPWEYKNNLDSPIQAINGDKFLIDGSQGSVTVILPDTPDLGHEIKLLCSNLDNNNSLIVNPGNNTIFDALQFTSYVNNIKYGFVWNGTTWIRYFFKSNQQIEGGESVTAIINIIGGNFDLTNPEFNISLPFYNFDLGVAA